MHNTQPLHWNEALTRLAELAALAPSSHNCQPWRLLGLSRPCFEREMGLKAGAHDPAQPPVDIGATAATHTLMVCIDRQRALRTLPTLEREMRMSVGGFASLLMNLLRLAGVGVQVQWFAQGWRPATLPGQMRVGSAEPVLALHLSGTAHIAQALDHPLAQWIARRHTVRSPYLPLSDPSATELQPSTCLPHSLSHQARWMVVPPGPSLVRLAHFYRQHAAQDFRHGAAWRETYRHLHFDAATTEGDGAGMPIEALFGPLPRWRRRLLQAVLHPAVLAWVGPLGLHARIGRDFEALVRHTGGVWALLQDEHAAPADERRAHVLAGEAVIDAWLAATRDGLAMQPISVTLQHPPIEWRLRRLLGVERPILFIARVGQPAPAAALPHRRRAASHFCAFDFSTSPSTSAPSSMPTSVPVLSC